MQSPLLAQPPIEHSQAQLEDLADRLIVGARLRLDDWPILVVAVERMIADLSCLPDIGILQPATPGPLPSNRNSLASLGTNRKPLA